MLFFMPNLYFVGDGLPITAPLSVLVLFWALCVKIIRDPDEDPAAFRLLSVLLVIASVLYIVPQIYGLEAPTRPTSATCRSCSPAPATWPVARPLFWMSLGLFALTAGGCSCGPCSSSALPERGLQPTPRPRPPDGASRRPVSPAQGFARRVTISMWPSSSPMASASWGIAPSQRT